MNAFEKVKILAHIAKWRFTWGRHDLDYREPGIANPKFMSAREAIAKIPDGAVAVTVGMAGNTRCQIFFWGVREAFEKTGHPKNLTWITVGAQGSRGRVPGTIEELALPGLVDHYICGHAETAKALLKHIDAGYCDLNVMPQGQMAFAMDAQGRGELTEPTVVGLETFLDPNVGGSTCVVGDKSKSLAEAVGDKLKYRLPKITVAMFTVPAADSEGNLYVKNACMFTESREAALAAHYNDGLVLASVAEIIPKDEANIFLPADKVHAIIVNPLQEQTGSIPQRKYWPMFTIEHETDMKKGNEIIRFVNRVMGITPKRGPVDDALARMASDVFTKVGKPGSLVNIGVGLPEEVCRLVSSSRLFTDVTFSTEVGVVGGVPAAGIFFGAAVNPKERMSTCQLFRRYQTKLEVALFGLLEVDSLGNVNVSKRGKGAWNYVGPGGLPDIAASAKSIIFMGSWMAGGKMRLENGRLHIEERGKPKFIEKVSEVTFSGNQALKLGKVIHYVTNVGIFKLTSEGMKLIAVTPGIDIQKDILDFAPMTIILPEGGKVPLVPEQLMTGKGFELRWQNA
jgi:propionate CoA-transferase